MKLIDLTPIIQAAIGLIAAIVMYRLVPLIKARTTAAQYATLCATVKSLVYAAEQIYGAGTGPEKLMHVKNKLREKGLVVDLDVIEAMVRELTIDQA